MIARARQIFGTRAEPETKSLEALPGRPDDGPAAERPEREPSSVLSLIEQTRAERKAHHDRVAGLFPKPETTEWSVREIAYDRTRRANVS